MTLVIPRNVTGGIWPAAGPGRMLGLEPPPTGGGQEMWGEDA
jgi:hypothetical protein